MIRLYLKQAWRLLKENPVLSLISILGTALAVCLIMVLVMAQEVRLAPYAPEVNRDRMLFVTRMGCAEEGQTTSNSHGLMAYKYGQKAFKALKTPESVSLVRHEQTVTLSLPASKDLLSATRVSPDAEFWRLFDFDFIAGAPFTAEEVNSATRRAVIVESVARKLYGTTEVVGRELLIDFNPHTICGVVRDISPLASSCYAQVWTPSTTLLDDEGWGGIMGETKAYILARSAKDFDAIRAEVEALRLQLNDANPGFDAYYLNQPDTQFTTINRVWANVAPDMEAIVRRLVLTLCAILIIPAINLSGMSSSRMRKRLAELGVRRAFGARRGQLLSQVLWENLLQTLLGGLIGLLLAIASTYLFSGLIYEVEDITLENGSLAIDFLALLSWRVFALALVACLILNLLSAFWPAWRASRHSIVHSLLSK